MALTDPVIKMHFLFLVSNVISSFPNEIEINCVGFNVFMSGFFLWFLYSVNLTEYVAMDPRVSVCVSVFLSVCVSVSSLQPKRVDRF